VELFHAIGGSTPLAPPPHFDYPNVGDSIRSLLIDVLPEAYG
jgi:hypothetical protein